MRETRATTLCWRYGCWSCALFLVLWSTGPAAEPNGKPVAPNALERATWIEQGGGRHLVHVFTDPNCPYCADLYGTLKGLMEERDLRVRWLPVAVVDTTSAGKAAAWLQAEDSLSSLDGSKTGFEPGVGGRVREDVPSADTERRLAENHRLLAQFAIPVVPTMLVTDRDGDLRVFQGSLSPLALGRIFDHLH
jgi:thiol:disulfide interchange protein DsbG